MSTALVTGGAGFIGGHLIEYLLHQNWGVRILDDLSTGSPTNLPAEGAVDVRHGDIRSLDDCRAACAGVDYVFHMAAIASVIGSIDNPGASNDVNITGTLNVLIAARDANVKRVVFSSSASVYGNADVVPTTEDQLLSPQSPYATGKACGEYYCRNFAQLYGIETVVLRYFNVFGPRQNIQSGYSAVIPAFITAAILGKQPSIFGDGLQTRDFVYVENVAQANYRAAIAPEISGRTYNVGCGEEVSLIDMLDSLERASRAKISPVFKPQRAGEVRFSRSDIARARAELGYEPTVDLYEGLERTYRAYAAAHGAATTSNLDRVPTI